MEKQYKPIRKAEAHRMFQESFHAIDDLKRCDSMNCGKVLTAYEVRQCEGYCERHYNYACEQHHQEQLNAA